MPPRSSGLGGPIAQMRNQCGSSFIVRRWIAPPLPPASQPSNTTLPRRPEKRGKFCSISSVADLRGFEPPLVRLRIAKLAVEVKLSGLEPALGNDRLGHGRQLGS